MLAHLQKVESQTGKKPIELQRVNETPALYHIFEYWLELHRARAYGTPISYSELKAWLDVTGRRVTRYEVEAIYSIEAKYNQSLSNGN